MLPRASLQVQLTVRRTVLLQLRSSSRRNFSKSNSFQQQPEIYDVVCVGGGPAGLSLLAGLRSKASTSNLKIALVEGQDIARSRLSNPSQDKYSNRCSSLTPSTVTNLAEIGAWSHIDTTRIQPYQEMQVWDGVTGVRVEFDWARGAKKTRPSTTIAYMTENVNLTTALLRRLDELGGVDTFSPVKVDNIDLGTDTPDLDLRSWPVLSLSDGRSLAARLLVGADGANSPVRAFANIPSRGWDYNRHGVVATVELEGPGWGGEEQKVAYQRFLPTGPVALLPLPGNKASLVWTTMPDRAAVLKSLRQEDLVAMVNAAFRLSTLDIDYMHTLTSGQSDELAWRLQHTPRNERQMPMPVTAVQHGTVASFPLKMRHADTYTFERVALIGDAAHTIHPLAGQGLNQGQGDAQALVKIIATAVEAGSDIGSTLSLDAYNAERYQTNNAMLGVVDKLHKLYSVESGPIVWARSLGLSAVNRLEPLKGFLMKQAAGS